MFSYQFATLHFITFLNDRRFYGLEIIYFVYSTGDWNTSGQSKRVPSMCLGAKPAEVNAQQGVIRRSNALCIHVVRGTKKYKATATTNNSNRWRVTGVATG